MILFTHPWLWAVLVPAGLVVILLEARSDGTRARRAARAALRLLLLALLVAAAADPHLPGRAPPPGRRLVVAVQDAGDLGEAGVAEAAALGAALTREARSAGAQATTVALDPGLAEAALAFGPDETGTVMVLANGRGDLEALARGAQHLRAAGRRVLARALPRRVAPPPAPGVTMEALDVPEVPRGPFPVRGRVAGPGPFLVRLLADGREVARQEAAGEGAAGATFAFEDVSLPPGPYELAVEARPVDAPEAALLVRRRVRVEGAPRVALGVADPRTSPLARALRAQGFPLEERRRADAEVVALDAATAAALPAAAQEELVGAIERGLGLLLVAGEDADAWGRLAEGPLAEVLPLIPMPPLPPPPAAPESEPPPPPTAEEPPIEPPKPDDGPGLRAERRPEEAFPISLLLVLDRSASMEGGKLTMAIQGARQAAATLSPTDRVGVMTFADDVTLDVKMGAASAVARGLGWSLAGVRAGGQTDIYQALHAASRVLGEEQAPIRHLVLLTDGRHTGPAAVFLPLVREMAAQGITLTAVGLGQGADEVLLSKLARAAPRGRFLTADTERELPWILVRDTQRVAEQRQKDAEAMARIQDERREPPPPEPDPAPAPPPPAPNPEPAPPVPDAPPPAPDADQAPLVRVRPHEALEGLGPLPRVGPPYRARERVGGAVLLRRGEEEPVLAAARFGLGRVLLWALPDDAAGLEAWPEGPRLLVQATRAVRAPQGTRGRELEARVFQTPEGAFLAIDAPPAAPAGPVRVVWEGPDGTQDLGARTPGGTEPMPLPPLPAGAVATVRLLEGEGGLPVAPPTTYLARPPAAPPPAPGDARALAAALGAPALDETAPLLLPAAPRPLRRPLWPWPLAAAALLLPLDVALHRRARRPA